jgi:DNA-directed RNA polymerase specialized sigma subunit
MYNERALEEILKHYPILRAQAALEAEQLKHMFPSCTANWDGQPHGSGVSDSTANYAVRREDWSPNMKKARALEIAIEALTAQEKDFVKYLYFEQWRMYQVGLRLGARRTQIWKIRKSALDKIAKIIL